MIRKITTKSGEIRWEVYLPTAGRRGPRLRRRFDRKVDAEVFEAKQRVHSKPGASAEASSGSFTATTFGREARLWIEDHQSQISPAHLKRMQGILNELAPVLNALTPDQVSPELVRKIQLRFLEDGWSATTANRKIETINTVLNYSVSQRRIPFNPSKGVKKLKPLKKASQFFTRDEAQDFLSFVSKRYPSESERRWVYAVYLLALNTGLRAGEIWGLQLGDIDCENHVLHVKRQYDRITQTYRPTKGKCERVVPLHEALKVELLRLCKGRTDRWKALFTNRANEPINHDNFKKRIFDRDIRDFGRKKVRFHDLRHTAITMLVSENVDLRTVQGIAGHARIQTTMGYTHLLREKIQSVAKTFVIAPQERPNGESHLRLIS